MDATSREVFRAYNILVWWGELGAAYACVNEIVTSQVVPSIAVRESNASASLSLAHDHRPRFPSRATSTLFVVSGTRPTRRFLIGHCRQAFEGTLSPTRRAFLFAGPFAPHLALTPSNHAQTVRSETAERNTCAASSAATERCSLHPPAAKLPPNLADHGPRTRKSTPPSIYVACCQP